MSGRNERDDCSEGEGVRGGHLCEKGVKGKGMLGRNGWECCVRSIGMERKRCGGRRER